MRVQKRTKRRMQTKRGMRMETFRKEGLERAISSRIFLSIWFEVLLWSSQKLLRPIFFLFLTRSVLTLSGWHSFSVATTKQENNMRWRTVYLNFRSVKNVRKLWIKISLTVLNGMHSKYWNQRSILENVSCIEGEKSKIVTDDHFLYCSPRLFTWLSR